MTVEEGVDVPAIACRSLGKRYGRVTALGGVDLDVAPGTIHALVGQNGAGKSTCLGILAGRIDATSGVVRLFGEEATLGSPRVARKAGIAAVYQELTIIPQLSTQANLFVGEEPAHAGFLDERTMRRRLRELCERLNVRIEPDVRAGRLSVADQQMLEIMRALIGEPRVLLLDEPTAALSMSERHALHRVMNDLRDQGVTLVFVSHNLEEVLDIADDITVFRDGRVVEREHDGAWDKRKLVASMLGQPMAAAAVRGRSRRRARAEDLLGVEGLTVPGAVNDVSFTLRAGELVGIGGLVGSGRTTILRALAGLHPNASGRIWMDGRARPLPRGPRAALRLGIGMIPEDRKLAGVNAVADAADNIVISDLGACSTAGYLAGRRVERAAIHAAEPIGFAPDRIRTKAGNLSGGNQQKLLFARWRHRPVRVLLADEPTRGVDVGAKADIAEALRAHAAGGAGVILVSSELEEVVGVCDRVIVISEGSKVGELTGAKEEITVARILELAFGVDANEEILNGDD